MSNFHAISVLTLTVMALVLFSRDRIPLATSCLFILVSLTLLFTFMPFYVDGVLVKPSLFFSGFGHEALIAISCLMILGKGLETTGALGPIAISLTKLWKRAPKLALLLTLIMSGVLSAFLNNTPIVVILMPVLVHVALRTQTPVSKFLIPLGLITIVGGMSTTIGTSTNLLVVGIAEDLGLPRMSMFHFLGPALVLGVVALLYLWLVAPRLLPNRNAPLLDSSQRVFNALLHIQPESPCVNKTLADIEQQFDGHIKIENILRGQGLFVSKQPNVIIEAGDRLLISDTPERLKEFEQGLGATLYSISDQDLTLITNDPTLSEPQKLFEVVITRGSNLHHQTLSHSSFIERFKLLPLAIHRAKTQAVNTGRGIADVFLRSGDILLVQGTSERIAHLKRNSDLLVLDGNVDLPHKKKSWIALSILIAVVLTAALDITSIAVSALAGVFLMLVLKVLDWRSAASALSDSVIMIIVASLALGIALTQTGGAEMIAQGFIHLMQGASPQIILSALILLMALLTNIVSNNAAAVIGTPVAFSIASQLGPAGVSPEPFVLAVLFGANMSFATPFSYQTNLLIYNAGGYKFMDFVRVGLPLTLLLWAVLSWLLPRFYQF